MHMMPFYRMYYRMEYYAPAMQFVGNVQDQDNGIPSASNDQVKWYNRLIAQMIRCFINNKQGNWDIHLQQLTGAIRATENRQTEFIPMLCY